MKAQGLAPAYGAAAPSPSKVIAESTAAEQDDVAKEATAAPSFSRARRRCSFAREALEKGNAMAITILKKPIPTNSMRLLQVKLQPKAITPTGKKPLTKVPPKALGAAGEGDADHRASTKPLPSRRGRRTTSTKGHSSRRPSMRRPPEAPPPSRTRRCSPSPTRPTSSRTTSLCVVRPRAGRHHPRGRAPRKLMARAAILFAALGVRRARAALEEEQRGGPTLGPPTVAGLTPGAGYRLIVRSSLSRETFGNDAATMRALERSSEGRASTSRARRRTRTAIRMYL